MAPDLPSRPVVQAHRETPRPSVKPTDQFRLLIDSVRDYAIYLMDTDGYVRSWNIGAERIKGYSADEIVGRHFSTFYPPEDVEQGTPMRNLRIAREAGRYEGEGWRLRKDGSRFWADAIITPLRDRTGELVGFAKITRDLSERKRAEEERLALALEHARLSDAERHARDELAIAHEKVALRDEFVRVAAHELRTPITAAKLGVQLLKRSVGKDASPGQKLALKTTESQIQKLERLIERLLDLTRIEAGALPLEREDVDLVGLVRGAIGTWEALTSRHDVVLVTPPHPLMAKVDPIRIEEVLDNLLNNAVKYSPGGGRIEVTLSEQSDRARITVRDHGLGVEIKDRPRLFERFYQAHSDRSGVGLGLHISRRFIEMHGGEIRAEFPEDGGSRFVISLPLG